jgi:ligand-binding sensor domain-containing protein
MPFIRDLWLNEQNASVNVQSILQSKTGYIWLATDEGLVRYNGSNFTKMPGAENIAVTALAEIGDNIFIGDNNGRLGWLKGSFKTQVQLMRLSDTSRIRAIASNIKGDTLWLGTESGIRLVCKGKEVTHLNKASGLSDEFIYDICPIDNNRFLAATDNGINDIEWVNGRAKVTALSTFNGLPDNIVGVIKPIPDSKYYWLGMQEGGIALYNSTSKTIQNFEAASVWEYGQVNTILPVSTNKAWIATKEGYLLEATIGNNFSIQIRVYKYPGHQFRSLLCDKAGNLWSATKNGLSMITANYLDHQPLSPPYSLKKVTALGWEKDNSIWLAQDSTLFTAKLNDSTSRLQPAFRANAIITCLYRDKNNRLWMGTMGKGLWYKNNGGKFVQQQSIPSLEKGNILSITGTANKLWVATLTGVDEIAITSSDAVPVLDVIQHHNKQSGIGSDYVYYLFSDQADRLWMATDGAGVCMYDGKRYSHWVNPQNDQTKVAYSIAQDASDNMWIGTYFKGLYHIKNGSNKFEKQDGITDANLSTLTTNATGQVLTVYDRCMDEWYPRSKQFRHFNYRMELGIDSTSEVLNCFTRDDSGNVYLPYEHGLLLFKNQDHQYDIRPMVDIISITTLSQKIPDANNAFEYNDNYIVIKYNGICFTNPERLHYRYRLVGFGGKWITTKDDAVTFSNLPPGKYTFQIQVTLNESFELARNASYSFTIKAPFWQSIWFYLLVFIFIVLCVFAMMKIAGKRQRERALLQKERMEFEYEHLKSQVNPHFLFNSLNTLTNLIEEDATAAVSYTERLADLYQNILAYRSRDLITLREDLEILSTYLYVQNSRFGAALQVQYAIPEDLLDSKKVVPMVLQMLVENALKHNVVSLSQPLKIAIMSDNEMLVVKNPLRPKISKEKGAGIALVNIRKRYSLLTKKTVTFGLEQDDYVVVLPLL